MLLYISSNKSMHSSVVSVVAMRRADDINPVLQSLCLKQCGLIMEWIMQWRHKAMGLPRRPATYSKGEGEVFYRGRCQGDKY